MIALIIATVSGNVDFFLGIHVHALIERGRRIYLACAMRRPLRAGGLEVASRVHALSMSRSPVPIGSQRVAVIVLMTLLRKSGFHDTRKHAPVVFNKRQELAVGDDGVLRCVGDLNQNQGHSLVIEAANV